jgi:hypothetical protein
MDFSKGFNNLGNPVLIKLFLLSLSLYILIDLTYEFW